MEVKRVCKKCGEVNGVNSNNLKHLDVYDEAGTHYKIMFYDCERCNERDVLQIDNEETMKIFRELKKLILKVERKRTKDETISQKEVKRKDKWMKELREKRERLNDLCNGKRLVDENKKVVVEQLTIKKVGDIIESNL